MKLGLFILTISFLMTTGLSAQESGSLQAGDIQEELKEISRQMDDLVKSEAVLRDRQNTRIMSLEEDIETSRQVLGRQISETENRLSQEQSLLREYINIINNNISSMETAIREHTENLDDLNSAIINIEQSLAGIRAFQEQTEEKLLSADERIASAEEKLLSAEERISSINAAVSRNTAWIEENSSTMDEMQNIEERISGIAGLVPKLESEFSQLSSLVEKESRERINSIQNLETNIREEITGLSQKISYTDQDVVERISTTESRISGLSEYIEERELYAAGAVIGIAFLLLMVAVASRRKTTGVERKLEQQNAELSHRIEEQGAVLDTRLLELLEKQIPLLSGSADMPAHSGHDSPEAVADHALAIALGEEIYKLMKRNKELSDKSQIFEELKTSLRRLWTAFREKGYEVVDLQDKTYHDDMPAKADFFLTHELLPGEQIVSRVIRPLIKHNNVTIQEAEVEVMVGE